MQNVDLNKAHYIMVTCIVVKDGKYLISKRSEVVDDFKNLWTVPGGKMEASDYLNRPRDTNVHWYNVLETAVRREVFEEVGLKIKNLQYLTSMTYIRHDNIPGLIISMYADYDSGEIKLNEEASDFEWITIEEARYYDLIEGIYEELLMLDNKLNGISEDEWSIDEKKLKSVKIGIDLDEVIVDFMSKFIEFVNERYMKNLRYDDFKCYDFAEVIGVRREDIVRMVDEFKDSNYFDEVELIDYAREIIQKLSKSNDLYVITSRHSKHKDKTHNFLERNFKEIFSDVFFTTDYYSGETKMNKSDICDELGVDIFLEDNIDFAEDIAGRGISVILFDKPWNQGELSENVKRVKSWKEAFLEIEKLRKNG